MSLTSLVEARKRFEDIRPILEFITTQIFVRGYVLLADLVAELESQMIREEERYLLQYVERSQERRGSRLGGLEAYSKYPRPSRTI